MSYVQSSHPQGVRWVVAVLTLTILASIAIAQETVLPPSPAQPITQEKTQDGVQLKLETDRQTIGVADRFRLTLSITAPFGTTVTLPVAEKTLGPFHVFKHTPSGPMAIAAQRQQWQAVYALEAQQPGEHSIPALTVSFQTANPTADITTATRQLSSDPIPITVTSLLTDDADVETPKDIAPPVGLDRQSLPAWAWITLLVLAGLGLLAGAGWWYWRRRQPTVVDVPPRPAHVLALEALEQLRQQKLIDQDQIEPFYVQLSSILRRYTEWRFGLRAPEQTTEEFLASLLTSGSLLGRHRELLSEFLEHCDLVKFARHEPTRTDMQQAFDSAKRVVEQTADDQVLVTANVGGVVP